MKPTYIHYKELEDKLWPHLIQDMPKEEEFYQVIGDEMGFFDEASFRISEEAAKANSIPFAKEFIDKIAWKIADSNNTHSMPVGWQPDPEKIYSVDELLIEIESHCIKGSCAETNECIEPKFCAAKKIAIIKGVKEEPKCGDCGQELTLVRPGKHQCDNPDCVQNAFEYEI